MARAAISRSFVPVTFQNEMVVRKHNEAAFLRRDLNSVAIGSSGPLACRQYCVMMASWFCITASASLGEAAKAEAYVAIIRPRLVCSSQV